MYTCNALYMSHIWNMWLCSLTFIIPLGARLIRGNVREGRGPDPVLLQLQQALIMNWQDIHVCWLGEGTGLRAKSVVSCLLHISCLQCNSELRTQLFLHKWIYNVHVNLHTNRSKIRVMTFIDLAHTIKNMYIKTSGYIALSSKAHLERS